MFVNKLFIYLTGTYLKKSKVFKYEMFDISVSYKDEDIGRFSNLH